MYTQIETNNGIYKVRNPVGRIGAIHFGIITKSTPTDGGDSEQLSPGAMNKLTEGFEEWSVKVLPHIIVEGPFKYEEMPGEDQYAIFLAMFSLIKVGKEFFRIVE